MNKTAVFTIASENYFAQVQTLLVSLQKTNPNWDRYFALCDDPDADIIDALKITETRLITMDELDIPDLNDMKFRYDIMELNTAIKPFVILKLLEKYERVVYLDPDIKVYTEMSKVNEAFDMGYNFVLTPHFNDYFENDGKHPDEPDIMRAGIYNFGFFAANNSDDAKKAVRWWAKWLEKTCINKQEEGIFVDQKFGDLLPSRHSQICILQDSGYNVAYWNLSHRKCEKKDDKYTFNGDELVFYHFSGYNPTDINNISKHQNRYQMDDIGDAKELFYEYAKETLSNDFNKWKAKKYSYSTFSDGREISNLYRKLYRESKDIYFETKGKNPFDCSHIFYDEKEMLAPVLINYCIESHKDAAMIFMNNDRNHWVAWLNAVLSDEFKLDYELVEYVLQQFRNTIFRFDAVRSQVDYSVASRPKLKDGVNLIGYIKSEHGVGEACRLTAKALSTTDLNWSAYDYELGNPCRQNDDTWDEYTLNRIRNNVSIFNINADQLPHAIKNLPREARAGYRIGVWYWELTEFPEDWKGAFDLVDEIWAPTKFIQENLKKVSPVPVIYMPPGLEREEVDAKYSRDYFGLPEKAFLFLNFFDAYSYDTRKNPYAAINAFKEAFAPSDENVGLILKVNNADNTNENVQKLYKAIEGWSNIHVIAKVMTRDEMNGLIWACDSAVSLHRSEGLGLLCEEAMFYGKPVIATNWSGNTDFMDETCACMVDYNLIPIGDYYGNNEPNQKWADAKVSDASKYMLKLVNDSEYYKTISEAAKKRIREEFSPETCGKRMQNRINVILSNKGKWIDRFVFDSYSAIIGDYPTAINQNELNCANTFWKVNYYRGQYGGPLKKLVKKIIRRMLFPLLVPICEEQERFNASTVRMMNELNAQLVEQRKLNEELINSISKRVDIN